MRLINITGMQGLTGSKASWKSLTDRSQTAEMTIVPGETVKGAERTPPARSCRE